MIEKARPPAWDLLTTPGRQLSPRSSRLRRGSSSSRLGWHLAPGIRHLVATTRKKKKMEKGEQSNREYSSKVLASKDLHYICIGINEIGSIYGLSCRMPE